MPKFTIVAAALLMLLIGPAAAQQQQPIQRYGEPDKEKSRSDIAREKDADRAYKNSLGRIPAKPDVDPWGGARATETKPAAAVVHSAKPKPAKPAAAAN